MVDIPLTLPNVGNALVQGTHAGYYASKTRQEQNAFAGEQAARPDIAAAIGGDQGAQGRVAQASPTTFAHIAPHIAKLDADKRAQVKSTAEAVALAANTFLQAAPSERAALYPQIVETLKSQGHDVSKMPPMMTESQARVFRGQSHDILKLMQGDEAERGRNARHNPVGGLPYDAPSWSTPAPAAAGPRADAGGPSPTFASAAPGSLPPGTFAPPDVAQNTSIAQAAPGLSAAPPPQMAQGAAPMAPQPSGEPQVVQGDSPGPTPQAAPGVPGPVATPPSAIPQGFQPMGHRDASGNLVPALIDGKPVYRNAQSGQMMLGDAAPSAGPAAAGPALAPQAAPTRAPVPTAPNAVVHTMPPGYEMVRQKGIPVVKDGFVPIISQNGPPLLLKPSDEKAVAQFEDVNGPNGIIGQRNKQTNQFHPITQPAAMADIPKTLKGESVYQALNDAGDPGRAAEIKSIVDGDTPIPSPASRVANAIETRRLVFQAAEPGFTDATHATRMAMKKNMATGKIGDALTAQGTLFNHLAELQSTGEDMKNVPYPFINKVGNWVGLNSGDPRVTNMIAVKHRVNEEAEKYFGGSGAVTVSGMAEAQKDVNEAQSPEQLEGAVGKMVKLIKGRQSELTAQINRGLAYPKERQVSMDDLLTPEAKASRDTILSRAPNAKAANSISDKLGITKPAAGGRPPLEDFQR